MARHEHDQEAPRDAGTVDVAHDIAGLAVVTLQGEHDLSTREALADALQRAAAHSNVVVDLSPCTFMDSTVINVLLSTANTVAAGGERLALVIPPEQRRVARVAEMTGLDKLLAVYETREAALAAFGRPA
jgi:anti-sigma B factor antagonist